MKIFRLFLVTALLLGSSPAVLAQLRLGAVFGDDMVLQRERPVAVWGWAKPGDTVTVSP